MSRPPQLCVTGSQLFGLARCYECSISLYKQVHGVLNTIQQRLSVFIFSDRESAGTIHGLSTISDVNDAVAIITSLRRLDLLSETLGPVV